MLATSAGCGELAAYHIVFCHNQALGVNHLAANTENDNVIILKVSVSMQASQDPRYFRHESQQKQYCNNSHSRNLHEHQSGTCDET